MSKTSLAVKYRPQTFDQLTEQSNIKQILEYQIKNNCSVNAYLFVGPAGTGKTTVARIFGTMLNDGIKNIIEIDAASNNGVDDVRRIIDESKYQDLSSNYKVYIIDECFPKNTKIAIPGGFKNINEFKVGDKILSMDGISKVTHVFNESVFAENLVCIKINNKKIITTKNHLFFTNEGWIEASKLKKGDILYDRKNMSILWKDISNEEKRRKILLPEMFTKTFSYKTEKKSRENLCNLWRKIFDKTCFNKENLFEDLQSKINIYYRETNNAIFFTDGKYNCVIYKNENEQSYDEKRSSRKNDCYSEEEWDLDEMGENKSGWKWNLFKDPIDFTRTIRRWMENRISNSNTQTNRTKTCISYKLQSRPRLSKNENSSRGRWDRTQKERDYITRFKETKLFRKIRVESVEIYKRGYNEELFTDSFGIEELNSGTVELYDLEVENNHTYFANDVLVHNCHMLTTGAWNAMLKLLEEPPLKTIFILCTTDTRKILPTIISRCQRYDFKNISTNGILNRLEYIIKHENLEGEQLNYTKDALEYIARLAEGCMRNAITLLDKCISFSKDLSLENVMEALSSNDNDNFTLLLDYLYNKDLNNCLTISEYIYQLGTDIKLFTKQYINFMVNVIKYCVSKDINLTNLNAQTIELLPYNTKEDINNLIKILNLFIKINNDIKYEQNPIILFQANIINFVGEDL